MNQPAEQPESVDIGKVVREIAVEYLKDKTFTEKELLGLRFAPHGFFGYEQPEGKESLPFYQDLAGHQYMFRRNGDEYKLV